MLAMDNLLMLRTFLRDYLHSFDKENGEGGVYWPCVCVIADRNNLNFNSDLPKKIGLQWDNLMPDFPYLSYRNAYLLGEGFTVQRPALYGRAGQCGRLVQGSPERKQPQRALLSPAHGRTPGRPGEPASRRVLASRFP